MIDIRATTVGFYNRGERFSSTLNTTRKNRNLLPGSKVRVSGWCRPPPPKKKGTTQKLRVMFFSVDIPRT